MPILADTIDGVIGVDTHRDTLAAAAVSPVGGVLAQTATSADATGYQQLLEFAGTQIPSDPARRCWAIQGTGSYGAGLTALLPTHGERVLQVARPKRPARRTGAKTDAIDAIGAARETLGHQHQTLPRRRGDREALGVLLTTRRHPYQQPGCWRQAAPRRSSSVRPRSCAPSYAAWRPPRRSTAVWGWGTARPGRWSTA
jgi:transposase